MQNKNHKKTEQWHPDINITEDFAQSMIQQQFPKLSPVVIKTIGQGWDNKVFLVNERLIFRLPHSEIAASLIERENAVLTYLQKRVKLKIPNPSYIGQPSDNYPYHFHGYPMIHGISGSHANLSNTTRRKISTLLAEFLKELHSVTESEARAIGASQQVFDRTDVVQTVIALTERVEKIKARNIASINLTIFNEEMKIARAVHLPKTKVLVHGDLYSRHLMFDNHKFVGIID